MRNSSRFFRRASPAIATVLGGGLGLLLNRLDIRVLGDVHLFLGSVSVLLIAFSFGPIWGALAAALAFSQTLISTGDSLALIAFIIEAIVAGWFVGRRRLSPVTVLLTYWLALGAPLIAVLSFSRATLPFPYKAAIIFAYPINGILIALAISPVYYFAPFRRWLRLPRLREANEPLRRVLFRRFGLIAVVPIIALSLVAGRSFDRIQSADAKEELETDARQVALRVESHLDDHLRALTTLALQLSDGNEPDISANLPLNSVRRQYPGFLTMLVIDRSGTVVAASPEYDRQGRKLALIGSNVADRDYFRQSLNEDSAFISDVFRGRGFGHDLIVAISQPIHDAQHHVIGVVEGSLNLGKIINAVTGASLVQNREFVVADRQGRVVTASGSLQLQSLDTFTPPAGTAGFGRAFNFDRKSPRKDDRPEQFIAVRQKIDSYGWEVFLEESVWQTESSIARFYAVTFTWSLVAAGVALLFAQITAKEITQPLASLVTATQSLAEMVTRPPIDVTLVESAPRELATIGRDIHAAASRLSRQNQSLAQVIGERELAESKLRQLLHELDQKVLERTAQLEEARLAAEKASQAKSDFLASMSHELRTPLNVILGTTQILLEGIPGKVNQHQSESLETISSSGQHLLSLINDILDLSKIEAGKMEADLQTVSVRDVCEASLKFARPIAAQKKQEVSAEYTISSPYILSDSRRLKQILVNLFSNAVKFTPDGGRIGLKVTHHRETDTLSFAVSDTGIGIAQENLSRLFQPFVQIEGSLNRRYSGTGLGLALVRKMVGLLGGTVSVESRLGAGSCFTVTIPRGNCDEPTSLNSLEAIGITPIITGNPLVLIADDSAANLKLYSEFLVNRGCRVISANDGASASDRAAADSPDAILMDVQMPGMDGVTAIEKISHDPRTASIPIIVVTALAAVSDRDRCLQAGARRWLTKPVDLPTLVAALASVLPVTPSLSTF